jgi:isoleucyl-tRNA synthetase
MKRPLVVADLFRREGSDAWFTHEAEEIFPRHQLWGQLWHQAFVKEKDIMDVWFDSGSSHMAVWSSGMDCDGLLTCTWKAVTSIGDGSSLLF